MNEKDQNTENEKYSISYYSSDNNNSESNTSGGDPTLENGYYYQETYTNSYSNESANPNGNSYTSAETNSNSKQNKKGKQGIRKNVLRIVASAILFGVVAGTLFQGVSQFTKTYIFKDNEEASTDTENNSGGVRMPIQTTEPVGDVLEQVEKDGATISDVVVNVMPSIVSIHVKTETGYSFFGQYYEQEEAGSGSGIIVSENENELLIVTNNHVVVDSNSIEVTFVNEESATAVVKGTDAEADLAVVAVSLNDINSDTRSKIKCATLGDSEDVKVGQMAIAIGNALGYGQSVTVGYISAKDREIEVSSTTGNGTNKMKVLQTDAAINPGNSGGALLNVKGEVVGINSVKYADAAVEGMGYAIPISRAIPIINELMNREVLKEEEKGYLGISGTDVSEEANQLYNIPLGVLVSEVSENGAAAEGGVQKGDIITAINDVEVKTIQSLKEKVNSYRIGTEFTLTVMRNTTGKYEEMKISITLKGMDTLEGLTEGEETNSNIPGTEEDPSGNPKDGIPPNDSYDEDTLEEFFNYFR